MLAATAPIFALASAAAFGKPKITKAREPSQVAPRLLIFDPEQPENLPLVLTPIVSVDDVSKAPLLLVTLPSPNAKGDVEPDEITVAERAAILDRSAPTSETSAKKGKTGKRRSK